MFPLTRQWADDLAHFVADHRAARPPRAVPMVAAEAAAHDAILAAHLEAFLDRHVPRLLHARQILAHGTDADPDPVVVVMTNPWGLPATQRALERATPGRFIAVTELEFRYWSRHWPDEAHRHHVNHWSWIKRRLPEPRQAEFAWLGAPADAILWLHRSGTTGTGSGDGLVCAVHHWDGTTAHLLTSDAARHAPEARS